MMLAQNDRAPLADPALIPYLKWLNEEAVYIITDEERKAFKSLQTNEERNQFIKQFWARRDPSYPKAAAGEYPIIANGNSENEFKKEHYRRIAYSNDRFGTKIPGWKTDRGRIYITYGPPDEIESHPSGGTYIRPPEQGGGQTSTYPFEQWMYRFIDGIGKNVVMEFVDTTMTGDYRLTMDPKEKEVPPSKPAELNYKDLEAFGAVGSPRYNQLPIKVSVSYAPLTPSAVLAVVTVQFDTKDLHFEDKANISTATVEIRGRFATVSRRPLSPFEDVVSVKHSTTDLAKFVGVNPPQSYERSLPLQPGRYLLNVFAKDLGSKNTATYEMIIDVPAAPQ